MNELDAAIVLAHRVLDEPGRDPDDDLSMMSRLFLRRLEQADKAMLHVADLTVALGAFCAAFSNDGETTSLHEWNKKMKAADEKAKIVLRRYRTPGASSEENLA
jgi:hypothetical protein